MAILLAAFIVGPGLVLTSVAGTPQSDIYRNLVTNYQDKFKTQPEPENKPAATAKVATVKTTDTESGLLQSGKIQAAAVDQVLKPKSLAAQTPVPASPVKPVALKTSAPSITKPSNTETFKTKPFEAEPFKTKPELNAIANEPAPTVVKVNTSESSDAIIPPLQITSIAAVATPAPKAPDEAPEVQAPQIETDEAPSKIYTAPIENTIQPVTPPNSHRPWVAIIIDDIGYSKARGMRAAKLPADITLAVIPHAPNSVKLAEQGHSYGKEIMLHAPMSNLSGKTLEQGALNESMGRDEFVRTLNDSLDNIPHIVGVNNHMGSLLTQKTEQMSWLMGELQARQLYFIDSRTSPQSQAYEVATERHIPTLKRDVFLDNQRSEVAIKRQFDKLVSLAKRRGWAIGIGHPYPETLAVLEKHSASAAEQIEFVSISKLLARVRPKQMQLLARAETTE